MGFFFADPANRIQFHELDNHLKDLKFSSTDRKELKKAFEKHRSDGISKDHIKKIAKSLRDNYKDRFNSYHADKLQKGLLGVIDQKMKPKVQVEKSPKPTQTYEFKKPEFKRVATPPPPQEPESKVSDLKESLEENSKDFSNIF